MVDVQPFPFATVEELKARWPDMPAGSDAHAGVLLEDASQFIVDTVPSAVDAAAATRRRIVCRVVRTSMDALSSDNAGFDSITVGAGPLQYGGKITNPNGDFYLTKQERAALGAGVQRAFGVSISSAPVGVHRPWCSLMFGATYCSCGVDIAGEPIFEGPE